MDKLGRRSGEKKMRISIPSWLWLATNVVSWAWEQEEFILGGCFGHKSHLGTWARRIFSLSQFSPPSLTSQTSILAWIVVFFFNVTVCSQMTNTYIAGAACKGTSIHYRFVVKSTWDDKGWKMIMKEEQMFLDLVVCVHIYMLGAQQRPIVLYWELCELVENKPHENDTANYSLVSQRLWCVSWARRQTVGFVILVRHNRRSSIIWTSHLRLV